MQQRRIARQSNSERLIFPSITNLISPVCGADLKSAAITDTDLAYLKAVYTMDPGANFQQQRNFIADRIATALGVR